MVHVPSSFLMHRIDHHLANETISWRLMAITYVCPTDYRLPNGPIGIHKCDVPVTLLTFLYRAVAAAAGGGPCAAVHSAAGGQGRAGQAGTGQHPGRGEAAAR